MSASASAALDPCANIEVRRLIFLFLDSQAMGVRCSCYASSVLTYTKQGPEIHHLNDLWMAEGAGNAIDTITSASLKLCGSEPSISSSDSYDLICSYNWVNKEQPTVYVPGGAPTFEEIPLPATLEPDYGVHFIDQNAARTPKYPFEVVFQAVELMNPNVCFDEIDVLANRNSLSSLLEFCKGRAKRSFRVNLHLVNDTLIIERCGRSTTEFLCGQSGFGRNFEKAVTRFPPGLEGSSGHHRVLRYNFGGLKCAVRFEVDASYHDPEIAGETEENPAGFEADGEKMASLVTTFSSMALNTTDAGPRGGSADTIRRGAGTAQTSVAELKSRTDHPLQPLYFRLKPSPEWLPQLWFGRTRYLVHGLHERGIFGQVHVHDMKEQLEVWEKKEFNQQALQKMAVLLSQLRNIVRTTKDKTCVVLCEQFVKPPVLRIHASTSGKRPLPASVVEKFWNKRTH